MQAIRQCSVCARNAAGGLVRNQADVSLFRRTDATCIRYLSSESRKTGVSRKGDLSNPNQMSLSSLSVGHGLWQVEDLSHDSLIRRAASLITDSSSSFLSQAMLALTDALTDYSKAVHSRIAFQKKYLASVGKMSQTEEETLREAISSWRAEAADRLSDCKHYESTWMNALDLSKMAAEAAYASGAHQASILIRTNIQVAQSQVEEARRLSAEADKKLAETKVEEIQRMAEYAASLGDAEELEVQEAYLRED